MTIDIESSSMIDSSRNTSYSALDPFHPIYLYSSDTLGTVLVSVPFSGTTFGDWNEGILISFAKNKIQLIDKIFNVPNPNSLLYTHWQRCIKMVKAWIYNEFSL